MVLKLNLHRRVIITTAAYSSISSSLHEVGSINIAGGIYDQNSFLNIDNSFCLCVIREASLVIELCHFLLSSLIYGALGV